MEISSLEEKILAVVIKFSFGCMSGITCEIFNGFNLKLNSKYISSFWVIKKIAYGLLQCKIIHLYLLSIETHGEIPVSFYFFCFANLFDDNIVAITQFRFMWKIWLISCFSRNLFFSWLFQTKFSNFDFYYVVVFY